MKLGHFLYFFRESVKSLSRNRFLSLATITTVAICILILGTFALMSLNAGSVMHQLESDVEIVAYLDDGITESEAGEIKKSLDKISGIKSVEFVPRDQALQILQEKFAGTDYDLATTLGDNPLPDTYQIKAKDPHSISQIAAEIEGFYGITKVKYGKDIVDQLFALTKWIRTVSSILIGLLVVGSIFLIATTIRLSIYARRKEIILMKLVGSTDWFIRWPFFIEGIMLGLVGSICSVFILAVGYSSILKNAEFVFFLSLVRNPDVLMHYYILLVLAGMIIGVVGTLLSLNRFIDV